jgi:hypothetical protein
MKATSVTWRRTFPDSAGDRWRRDFRGPRDRPRAAPDRPAARPEAVVVERHRPRSRRPTGLGQHERRNAVAPATRTVTFHDAAALDQLLTGIPALA